MTYKEARVYLDHVSKYGSVLGLDTIRELLHELGDPQQDLKFIHIAGTNGKGSVLAYISSVLSEAGYRTGRYVSPTVISYLERIQIDGASISEEAFARLTDKAQQAIARMEAAGKPSPTVFEVETAIAFLYFKETYCDYVVLECGMGGEGDATNIIPAPLCAVFASINLDHLGILGNSIEEIARTKKAARQKGCPFHQVDDACIRQIQENRKGQTIDYREQKDLYLPLPGGHQAINAAVALETLDSLRKQGLTIPEKAIQEGFKKVQWFGRFTCLMESPWFFIDGAHNPAAARCLAGTVRRCFPDKRLILIMGVFRDKEYEEIAKIMAPLAKSVHTVTLPDEVRSLSADVLADTMRRFCGRNVPVTASPGIMEAVASALNEADGQDAILAFGSLSYLGRIKDAVSKICETKTP